MNEYLLYLPPEQDRVGEKKLICQRWEHLMAMIDREHQTVRTYIVGIDIDKTQVEDKLPYLTLNGNITGFQEAFDKVMVKTMRAVDGTSFDEDIL
jgi:hypothetical protein|tara:strand:- start:47 stop:331 length:285 start_codon:yes stop_codon:yes gene_type:complete